MTRVFADTWFYLATPFVVMEDEGIRDALTGDRHFEQAGFTALVK